MGWRDRIRWTLGTLRIAAVFVGLPILFICAFVLVIVGLASQVADDFHLGGIRAAGFQYGYKLPVWSPDGRRIIFTYDSDIYTVGRHGTPLERITGDAPYDRGKRHHYSHSPDVSPDGVRIAFAAFGHSTLLPWSKDLQWEIVTSKIDGSDRRRLTKSDNDYIVNSSPAWSPDGSEIAFVSNRASPASEDIGRIMMGSFEETQHRIFVMRSDGSHMRSVAPSVNATLQPPIWSPDGSRIAFTAMELNQESQKWEAVVYSVEADGSSLARHGWTVSSPAWSPDNSRIAFIRFDNALGELLLHLAAFEESDSTDLVEFEGSGGSLRRVVWSPDGTRLLLSGGQAVGVVDTDGNTLWLDVISGMRDLHASWSPDGDRIAVYDPPEDLQNFYRSSGNEVLFTADSDGSDRRILVRAHVSVSVEGRLEAANDTPWFRRSGLGPPPTPVRKPPPTNKAGATTQQSASAVADPLTSATSRSE